MILAQSAATARVYAARHHQRLDADQDIVGLAAANAAAALSGGFVVNGSPTQTAMLESAGSRSQLAQVAAAATVALVLLFLTKPMQYLPQCVLGAMVFLVAIHMIDLRGLRDIRKESPAEFALATDHCCLRRRSSESSRASCSRWSCRFSASCTTATTRAAAS